MKNRISIILLILLSIGMLFPFYLTRQFFPAYKSGFLHTNISHIVVRFVFYGILASFASSVFSNKNRIISPIIVILCVLSIALLQEFIQLLAGQGPIGWDDGFDVLVDMSGAAIGLFVFRLMRRGKTTKT